MADKSKNMMPIASKALGIKHNKLRVGIKEDVLNAKYHGRSIAGSDFSQSNDNLPDNSLICLLLVGNDIELRNYVLENWKYLDAIVGNHLDICLVGYRGKSFIGKEFMKTVHQLQETTNWKWRDVPVLLIAKIKKDKDKYEIEEKKCFEIDIKASIKVRFAKTDTLAGLLLEMVNICKKSKKYGCFL